MSESKKFSKVELEEAILVEKQSEEVFQILKSATVPTIVICRLIGTYAFIIVPEEGIQHGNIKDGTDIDVMIAKIKQRCPEIKVIETY